MFVRTNFHITTPLLSFHQAHKIYNPYPFVNSLNLDININTYQIILIVSLQLVIKTIPLQNILYPRDHPHILSCALVSVIIFSNIFLAPVRFTQNV